MNARLINASLMNAAVRLTAPAAWDQPAPAIHTFRNGALG